jgi:hypothetical protein
VSQEPQLNRHPSSQRFYGAEDLDIAAVANDRVVTLPRIFAAGHNRVSAALSIDKRGWTADTAVTLQVTDATSRRVAGHEWKASSGPDFEFQTDEAGWQTLSLAATGLPDATPFELDVSYRAPQTA